jgi:3-oxoacyl-[acyl-carrier-protein] synthase II
MTLGQDFYKTSSTGSKTAPWQVIRYQPQVQALDLAEALGFETRPLIIANACASGANAIGWAWNLVRTGRHARVVAGGYDALCQLVFAGFDSLQALSATPCRPFDAHRDGLSLGEGAAVLMLESLQSALDRNATILGEIIGYSAVTDVHHLTQPKPDGNAAWIAMREACAIARVSPAEVDYVNAHGTATPLNDSAEANAISSWAGEESHRLLVSSTKAGIGHLLGAAGAVEAALCIMSLAGQWLPPQGPVATPDPLCKFQLVTQPLDSRVTTVVSNSFGFGGANASLVLRRWS